LPCPVRHTHSSILILGASTMLVRSAAVLMICRGMFGIGMLSMPYMFTLAGVNAGCLLLLLFAINSTVMASALVLAAPESDSYEEACRRLCGKWAERFLVVNIVVANVGTCAAYIDTAALRLSSSAAFYDLPNAFAQRILMVVITSLLVLPFTWPPKLLGTAVPSALSLLLAIGVGVSVIVICSLGDFGDGGGEGPNLPPAVSMSSILRGVPLSCYAFSAMSQVFPVYSELAPSLKNPRSMASIAATSASIALALYAGVGMAASSYFGIDTKHDVLANLEVVDPRLFHSLGIVYSIGILMGVPLMMYPARRSMVMLLASVLDRPADPSNVALATLSTVLLVIATLIAFVARDLLPILDVLGALSAIAVDTVLPGILFFSSCHRQVVSCHVHSMLLSPDSRHDVAPPTPWDAIPGQSVAAPTVIAAATVTPAANMNANANMNTNTNTNNINNMYATTTTTNTSSQVVVRDIVSRDVLRASLRGRFVAEHQQMRCLRCLVGVGIVLGAAAGISSFTAVVLQW